MKQDFQEPMETLLGKVTGAHLLPILLIWLYNMREVLTFVSLKLMGMNLLTTTIGIFSQPKATQEMKAHKDLKVFKDLLAQPDRKANKAFKENKVT